MYDLVEHIFGGLMRFVGRLEFPFFRSDLRSNLVLKEKIGPSRNIQDITGENVGHQAPNSVSNLH